MALITYKLTFDADAQGLTDEGLNTDVTFQYYGADGSPSAGCVRFASVTGSGTFTCKAKTGSGLDWTHFGVPAGATVTGVQATGYNSKTGFASGSFSVNVLALAGSALVPVYSGGNLLDLTLSPAQPWTAQGAGPSRSVSAGYQAAATHVWIELVCQMTLSVHIETLYVDTIVLEITTAGGGAVYTETPNTRAAGRASTLDTQAVADVVGGRAAARTAETDAAQYADVVNAKGAGIASVDDGSDVVMARGAGRIDAGDTGQLIIEVVNVRAAGRASVLDSPTYIGRIYRDFVGVIGGGRAGIEMETQAAQDVVSAQLAALSQAVDLCVYGETPNARGAGRAAVKDGKTISEAVNTRGAGRIAALDTGRLKETVNARAAGIASEVDALHVVQLAGARGAGKVAQADVLTANNVVGAKGAGKAAAIVGYAPVETVNARGAASASVADKARAQDKPNARGAGAAAQVDTRTYVETVNAKGAGRANIVSAPVVHVELPRAFGAGMAQVKQFDTFGEDDLIRTLRAFVGDTLPEVTGVPEALSDAIFGKTGLTPPYVVLVVQPPREDETAVFSTAVWIPVDVVYCVKNVGARDNDLYARQRLNVYADAVYRDHHLSRGTGAQVANDVQITETPHERKNEYQQFFADAAQPITAKCLTIECRLVYDLVK